KLDLGGVGARLGNKAEFELGGRAQDFLKLARVLQARHFDENAIIALALNVWLRGAECIDPAAEHFNRLLNSAAHLSLDARIGHGELNEAIFAFGHIESRRAASARQDTAACSGKLP